jgi:hypothetical protein
MLGERTDCREIFEDPWLLAADIKPYVIKHQPEFGMPLRDRAKMIQHARH